MSTRGVDDWATELLVTPRSSRYPERIKGPLQLPDGADVAVNLTSNDALYRSTTEHLRGRLSRAGRIVVRHGTAELRHRIAADLRRHGHQVIVHGPEMVIRHAPTCRPV